MMKIFNKLKNKIIFNKKEIINKLKVNMVI